MAAGIPHGLKTTDTIELGRTSSTDDREIEFNTGDGASNRKIIVPDAGSEVQITGNTLSVGDDLDTDKFINARNGDANLPFLKYNSALSRWEKSNDGLVAQDIGAGGGPAAANRKRGPAPEASRLRESYS